MFRNQYLQEEEEALRLETGKINTILEEKYIYKEKKQVAVDELLIIARSYDALIQVIDQNGDSISFYDHEKSEAQWGALADSFKRKQDESGTVFVSFAGMDIWPNQKDAMYRVVSGQKKLWPLQKSGGQPLNEQGALFYDIASGQTDMPMLTLVRTFVSGGKMDGVILMHLNMSAINESISRVYMDVLLIGLMAIAAAVLAVYYLTTRITKPITNMSSIVKRYSKGEFALRIQDEGADEVAQLAKSFNSMAGALNSLEQMRRSFVANVSHELRSPLTSISGFLEAIQDGTIPQEKHGEYLTIVIAETKRMTNMVNNLLDLARIESGQTDMYTTVFDINELARRMVLTFEARINAKKLNITLDLLKPNCYVEADMDQIGQVLRNLIDNAIKFSPEGGDLLVETAVIDRHTISVSVQDQGAGIPEEDVPHVFERFYKAEKAHTPSAQSGTGLGLSISKVIVDQHGQDIFVESKVGQGTRFTFTLHRSMDLRRRLEIKPAERNRQVDNKGETI